MPKRKGNKCAEDKKCTVKPKKPQKYSDQCNSDDSDDNGNLLSNSWTQLLLGGAVVGTLMYTWTRNHKNTCDSDRRDQETTVICEPMRRHRPRRPRKIQCEPKCQPFECTKRKEKQCDDEPQDESCNSFDCDYRTDCRITTHEFPGTANNGNVRLFYREAGHQHHRKDGKNTVIMLHGVPLSSEAMIPLMRRIACRYHVIALDQRGFGHSDKPNDTTGTIYTLTNYTIDVHELATYLQIQHPILLGHDFGGLVAQLYTLSYATDDVYGTSELLLISTTSQLLNSAATTVDGVYYPAYPFGLSDTQINALLSPLTNFGLEAFLRNYINQSLNDRLSAERDHEEQRHLLEKVKRFALRLGHETNANVLTVLFTSIVSTSYALDLTLITIPTLVLFGSLDQVIPVQGDEYLSLNIGKSFTVELRGAGHFPHLTRADLVGDAVFNFLENKPSPTSYVFGPDGKHIVVVDPSCSKDDRQDDCDIH